QQEPLGIDDLQGDAVDLSRWVRQTFDLVLRLFMFYDLDLARLTICLGEVARVLRPGGRLVLVVPHPLRPYLLPPVSPTLLRRARRAIAAPGTTASLGSCGGVMGRRWRCRCAIRPLKTTSRPCTPPASVACRWSGSCT